jgi:S-adenosylmethionine uptake transporter
VTNTEAKSQRLAGIAWMLFGAIFLGGMSAMTRMARAEVGPAEVIFMRSVVVVLVSGGMMRMEGVSWRPGSTKLMMRRAGAGLIAMALFFWSLGEIPLGSAVTLLQTAPLFIALFSGRVLGEASSGRTLAWTLLAFLGVGMILDPLEAKPEWGMLAALAAGFIAAMAYMTVRELRKTDPPSRIVFWFGVVSAVCSAPVVIYNGAVLQITPMVWAALLGVGITGTVGQVATTRAYRLEKANIVGPFSYATVGVAYLFGVIFWQEVLSWHATLGMALVVASGVMISRDSTAPTPPKHPKHPKQEPEATDG